MITLENVKKYYYTKDNLAKGFVCPSLTIPDGEVVGVLGANGAGKTTMLKCLMGLTGYDGEIRFDGQPASGRYADLSYITEEGSFLPFLNPVEYGDFLADFWPHFDKERYKSLIEFFGLTGRQDPIGKFSNGEQAKVEVAAGFARRAKYVLMDEPFLGKDVFTRRDFLKLMAGSLHGEETILISTHQIEEIELFLDRALIIQDCEIVANVLLDDLREEGRTLIDLLREVTGYDPERYREFL